MKKGSKLLSLIALLLALAMTLCSCDFAEVGGLLDELFGIMEEIEGELDNQLGGGGNTVNIPSADLDSIPEFDGSTAYVKINGDIPYFTDEEKVTASYEIYAPLDILGRCTYAISCIGIDLMPTEDRGSIGQVKPSGWQTVKYDVVDGKYLYNRCHLIGYQLTGENANKCNLITGTRYLNVIGMLPFEDMVADYIKETENHVMYRVTPIYEGNELVARGVLMEGYSVEDNGEGICFCIYAYNNQPGVIINYADGTSELDPGYVPED